MECREVRAFADAYLDDELLVETNHAVLAHLQQCRACQADLKARQSLRATLKTAVDNDQRFAPRADFPDLLRRRLRPTATETVAQAWLWRLPGLAAALVVLVLGIQWGREARRPVQTMANDPAVSRLTASAVGDHRDCALRHQPSEPPMPLDRAASYDAALRRLDEAVRVAAGSLPVPLESVTGHACVWKGRRFGHVVLSYKSVITSVLVTTPAHDVGTYATGTPVECPTTSEFAVACFAAPQHAIFVVSQLPSNDTMNVATILAPPVRNHLSRVVAALRAVLQELS